MAFMEDNTAVIRMKRDFEHFMQDHNESRISAFSLDGDRTTNLSNLEDSSAISVKELLEKEKRYKQKEAEYIAAKSQILRLESKLSNIENTNKRAKLEVEHKLEALQNERSRETKKMEDLWAKLKYMTEKEAQTRESLAEYQKEVEKKRAKYEEQILALQKENIQLSDDLQQEKEQSWEKTTELKGELLRKETELKIRQNDLEETKAKLKLQLKRSSDISNQMKDCEELRLKNTQAEQKIKDLELQISRMEEDNVVAKAMKTQLTTFQEMEKETRQLREENQYLRDIQENNLLLKEQHDSMKRKLERMEDKIAECSKVATENEDLKARLEKWETAERAGPKIKSPSNLSKRVSDLQTAEILLLTKQGELQSNYHLLEANFRQATEQVTSFQQMLTAEKAKNQQQADLMKRIQRKLLLVTKELDGYKRIIDSYESEVTVSVSGTDAQAHNRIQHLEEGIMGYKKQTELLEAELNKANEEISANRQHTKQMEKKILELQQLKTTSEPSQADHQTILQLREKIASLEKSLEKCEEEKYILECRIEQRHLQGDYDPSKVKVLHFKMNPVDMATSQKQEAMKKLQEENERLKQRVKLLEENEGRIEDLTVCVEQRMKEPGSSKDIEEMRKQLTTAELKNKRLMEAFKKKSQEIREVCYRLTGFKIDIPNAGQYRLTSMYADSPSDFLLFQQDTTGEIQMLGTAFAAKVEEHMNTYLIQQNSIPAFLSSVTLELFSCQTKAFG